MPLHIITYTPKEWHLMCKTCHFDTQIFINLPTLNVPPHPPPLGCFAPSPTVVKSWLRQCVAVWCQKVAFTSGLNRTNLIFLTVILCETNNYINTQLIDFRKINIISKHEETPYRYSEVLIAKDFKEIM